MEQKEKERKNKNNNIVRVLHVLGTVNLGGAESRIMELYRVLDQSKVQFDFLVHTNQPGHYSEEICALGGHIYSLPRFRGYNGRAYQKAIHEFFREHQEFSVIQGHMTSTASIYLPIAKKEYHKQGREVITIAHARSAGVDQGARGLMTKLLRTNLSRKTDYCFACSKEAGLAVFGKTCVEQGKVRMIPNAIDTARFRYQESVRHALRQELGIDENTFVIGHVGRLDFMKNHKFLVEVFAQVCRQKEDSMLVLIGKGKEQENISQQLKQLGEQYFHDSTWLSRRTMFLGNRFDVERYYQIFDYFVFPSLFEGLPGSVVEAQASGLLCLVSDRVTREVGLTNLVTFRSIEEEPVVWAEEILNNLDKAYVRMDVTKEISAQGFDVREQASIMEAFYRS